MDEFPEFSKEQSNLVMVLLMQIHRGDYLHYAENDRASAYSDIDNNVEDLIVQLFELWHKPLYEVKERYYNELSDRYWVERVTDGSFQFSSKDEQEAIAKCNELNIPFLAGQKTEGQN